MTDWKFHVDYRGWDDSNRLFIRRLDRDALQMVAPLTLTTIERGQFYDLPTISGEHGLREVDNFLQGALEAAWERGLRPRGFADHNNELKAVRYHLEDMRALAKVPRRESGQ